MFFLSTCIIMARLVAFILFCGVLHVVVSTADEENLPRIAVIGAGLGGTSVSFYLRQLFGQKAQIDIFEAERVGGRVALISIGGQDYEAGGTVIHTKNRYMVEFASRFNKSAAKPSSLDDFFGLCDDSGIFFETSKWQILSLAKLFWRYGLDLYTCQQWTSNMVSTKFNRIYDFQEKGIAFTTLEEMLRAMSEDFLNMTHHTLSDVLSDIGLSQRFIKELAMAAMRANYGQTTETHGFVGAVSLVGAEPGLWRVAGGNNQIAEALLDASKASLIKAKVKSVALSKDELGTGSVSYEVEYEETQSVNSGSTTSKEYDIVIIAAPVFGTKNKVTFVNFPNPVTSFTQDFHTTIAMFVQGSINASTFNLESEKDFPPSLLTVNTNLFFSAVGLQSPVHENSESNVVDSDNAVWKTFLNKVPTEEQIRQLFDKYDDLRLVDWLAYPEYKHDIDLPPFILYDKLYYINAIESAASAMEMSIIGARNVALLAHNQWYGHFDKIDEINPAGEKTTGEKEKSEL